MIIDISSIKDSSGESLGFEGQVPLENLSLGGKDILLAGPLKVSGTITSLKDRYLLVGRVTGKLNLVCDRCLREFEYSLDEDFEQEYSERFGEIPEGTAKDADYAYGDEDEDVIEFFGDTIDISSLIKDIVLLSLPIKCLCSEDCKGLCPKCGKDLNKENCDCEEADVDIRLAELAKLKGRLE